MELNEREKEFYSQVIGLHQDSALGALAITFFSDRSKSHGLYLPGITLASVDNPYIKEDGARFPDDIPFEEYSLVFSNGFGLVGHYMGTHFAHASAKRYEIEGGRLVYNSKERGAWPMLETFPSLTAESIRGEIVRALKGKQFGFNDEILKLRTQISQMEGSSDELQKGIERLVKK